MLNEYTPDELRGLGVWIDKDKFDEVQGETVEDRHRWFSAVHRVVKHKETGRYFLVYYNEPATEMQEFDGFGSGWYEVEPKTVQTIEYVRKETI